jgi:hypothetical protein
MSLKNGLLYTLISFAFIFAYSTAYSSNVIYENNRIYLEDRTGERWDITDAVSIGFSPGGFDYGIGKYAFAPLDESHIKDEPRSEFAEYRVIGIASGDEAHAYSVPKLRYHEIANTTIGNKPVTVGY